MAARVDIKRKVVATPIKEASVWDHDGEKATRKLTVTYNTSVTRIPYVNICGHVTTWEQATAEGKTSLVSGLGVNFHAQELDALIEILGEVRDQLRAEPAQF